jgi:hypothetical protein
MEITRRRCRLSDELLIDQVGVSRSLEKSEFIRASTLDQACFLCLTFTNFNSAMNFKLAHHETPKNQITKSYCLDLIDPIISIIRQIKQTIRHLYLQSQYISLIYMDIHYEKNGVSFVWNARKAVANAIKHDGITFDQAAEAFFDPFLKLVEGGSYPAYFGPQGHTNGAQRL